MTNRFQAHVVRNFRSATCAIVAAMWSAGCGGSSSGTNGPSTTPAATITIGTTGASPRTVTVQRGSQVQFVNNDRTPHQMNSDPHPEHTDCPELNAVGFLSPGQSRQTGNLNTARTCRFHDHDNPFNTTLQGSIVVQ
jgi:plastocyanin